MKKRIYMGAAALFAAFSLSACGDDSNSSNESNSVVKEVDKIDDLGKCEKGNFGEIVYVAENDSLYECTGDGWVVTDSSAIEKLLESSSGNSDGKSSSSFKVDTSETKKIETVKVESVSLTGFAQKGPFEKGAAVTVYGLDSLLEKTKTKFTGKVAGDSGAFKVEKISFPSQYALVEVNGYYVSEASGKKSGGKSTLKAIVDLSGDKSVKANVNIFTELEYARAKYLVAKEKFNVPAAKKRATKELLALFGKVELADASVSSTDLSLMDTTAAGTALLSASILLPGELATAKFSGRLGEIADIFAATGALDSAEIRAELADWASRVDSTDNFKSIRDNVKKMKLVPAVPNFESVLYAFWTNEYKLGACTDSLEEKIVKNENKNSENFSADYVCTSKRWHKSSELDKELGLCVTKKEGNYEERKLKKDTEYYVCRKGTWLPQTETEYELKECTDARNNEIVEVKGDASYVCEWDGRVGSWREASDVEIKLGICGDESVKMDSIYKTEDEDYFLCSANEWTKSDQLSYEMQTADECTDENNLTTFETESLGLYVCENKEWREADKLEAELGVCGGFVKDSVVKKNSSDDYYACIEKEWVESDSVIFELGFCKSSNANKIFKTAGGQYYRCDEDEWGSSDQYSYEMQNAGECTEKNNLASFKTENLGLYVCENKEWREASELESEIGVCGDAINKDGTFKQTKTDEYYACYDKVWITVRASEFAVKHLCRDEQKLDTVTYSGKKYYCHTTEAGSLDWLDFKLVDSRDQKEYSITRIGKQIWMAENLKYTKNLTYFSSTCTKDCNGDYSKYENYDDVYYLLNRVLDNKVCPSGWHLPDSTAWDTLFAVVEGSVVERLSVAGEMLKSRSGWNDDGNGNDSYGFTATPRDYFYDNSTTSNYSWRASIGKTASYPYLRGGTMYKGGLVKFLYSTNGAQYKSFEGKSMVPYKYAVPARCIKD